MSRAVLDSATTEAEPIDPPSTIRAVLWAVGIGISGALVLVVVLATNLLFDASPGASRPAAPRHVPLSAPDRIGDLQRRAEPGFADLPGRATAAGLSKPFTVTYVDRVNPLLVATVWGGNGPLGDAEDTLRIFRAATSALLPGAAVAPAQPADASPVAGTARCSAVEDLDVHATICVWTAGDAVLAILAGGYDTPAAAQLLPDLLSALTA